MFNEYNQNVSYDNKENDKKKNSNLKKIILIAAVIFILLIVFIVLYYFLVIRAENLKEPTITLDIPEVINDTDNYSLPTATDLDPSKGTVVCTDTTTGKEVSSSLDLMVGKRTVSCTATKKNGVSSTVTKEIMVNGYYDSKTPVYKLSATDGAQEQDGIITIPENTYGIQYGPYKPYEAGVYLVTVTGENLESTKAIKVYSANQDIDYNIISATPDKIVYKINILNDVESLETVAIGAFDKVVSIENVTIVPSEEFEYNGSNDIKVTPSGDLVNGTIQLKSSKDYTYGPYKTLTTGYYHVIINGINVDEITKVEIVNFNDNVREQLGVLSSDKLKAVYCIDLKGKYLDNKAEIYIYGKDDTVITINNYIINRK